MSGHTPGPWRINGKKSIRGPNGEYIGQANWKNGEANASLIAAAPELLEFAKWAMGQLCGDSGTGESHWEQFKEFREGQAAIAKAEGKQ